MTKLQFRHLHTSTAIIAALGLALPAFAQDSAETAAAQSASTPNDDVIIVTGSRIQRNDLELSSPVTVVSNEAIKLSGAVGVEEYLRDIPQAVTAIGSNTNNGNEGAATVDLRNLGEERTLVLVDGKRFVPYDGDGIVDLNMIPPALVERVEVVTGGASAVYGSDAISGVVNFILRDDFEGLEAEGLMSISEKGDSQSYTLSLTGGLNFAGGRGNITVNGGYAKQEALFQGDREFSLFALAAEDFGPGGSATTPNGFVDLGDGFQFNANGDLIADAVDPARFNFNPFNLLQAPHEKYTATAVAKYEFSDSLEAFGRFSYAESEVRTIIAPTGTFFFPFELNYETNPFISDQARSIFAAQDTTPGDDSITFGYGRRLTELGTRDSVYSNAAWQGVGGLRGKFGSNLKWEVFAQYAETDRSQQFLNDVSFNEAQQAILVVDDGGGPVCRDASNSCVPANIFGPGNLSAAAGDFIRLDLREDNKTSQFVVGGFLSGDLPFAISETPGAFVVGAEYRKEDYEAIPDDNLAQGNSIGFGSSTPVNANYDVKEVYGEINIPILEDRPFFESLSIEGGVRYSDYQNEVTTLGVSNSFSNWSYKIGAEWSPVSDLRFRAAFQRAVRAPNLNEIGEPRTPSTGDANFDPCQGSNPIGNATLTALCLATGVPAENLGSVGGPISGQINNFVGGTANIVPEKSNTWTVGVVLTPTFLPDFTATVDYFDITVNDAILQVPEQSVLDACYLIEQDASGAFCSLIDRNPLNGRLIGGTETGVDVRVRNIGFLRSRGIDVSARYGIDIGDVGTIDLGVNLTRQLRTDLQFADLLPVNECEGLVGTTCLRPDPKWRWTQTTAFTTGDFTVQLRWQHIGSLTNDNVAFGVADASDFVVPKIGSFDYFDLTSRFRVADQIEFRAGVNNLFDKSPPVVGNDYGGTAENSGNTYPGTYDPIGRSFFIGATLTY
ncbi:TonB-dependent receptor [Pacificimonas sp. WHA3]|uniref:TonB-dependent receptor n=1 Tax=Pacificimonas pallii TaxID=2827236 RepID=A0ABS6SAR2_9SPHN|nr:TonB-dependent receptor [Pacificimonas pallii]MBV7255494.1 TonB-dependent receptor [Pacificimonas pallii]